MEGGVPPPHGSCVATATPGSLIAPETFAPNRARRLAHDTLGGVGPVGVRTGMARPLVPTAGHGACAQGGR